jgi:hypothetical protein
MSVLCRSTMPTHLASTPTPPAPRGVGPSQSPLFPSPFHPARSPVLRSHRHPLFLFSAPSSEPKHTAPTLRPSMMPPPSLGHQSRPPHRGFTPECRRPPLFSKRPL